MFDCGSSWNRQHHGRSPEEPSQRHLCRTRTVCLRDSVQHLAGYFACPQWEPGNEGNLIALTIIHHVVPFAVRKTIAVLHRNDRDNSARSLDVLLRDVEQSNQTNLAFVPEPRKRFYLSFKQDNGVSNVQC